MYTLCWSHDWCGATENYFLNIKFEIGAAYLKFATQSDAINFILEPKTLMQIAKTVRRRQKNNKSSMLCVVNHATEDNERVHNLLDEDTRAYYYGCIEGKIKPSQNELKLATLYKDMVISASEELDNWDKRFSEVTYDIQKDTHTLR